MPIVHGLSQALGRFGYEVRRTDAKRRSILLHHNQVDLVLDVGAAKGEYATELRRHGYQGRIVSFEPLDDAYEELKRNASGDQNWTAVQTAVGSRTECTTINIAGNSKSSSILPMLDRHVEAAPHTVYVGSQDVKVQPLDALVLSDVRSARNPVLKIDTQGYERSVLDGAHEILKHLRGVQIELSLVPLYEGAMNYVEAIERLNSAGFVLQLIEPGFRDTSSQQLLQVDAIFLRPHAD